MLLAATEGLYAVPLDDMIEAQERVLSQAREHLPDLRGRILDGEDLSEEDRAALVREGHAAIEEED